MADSQVSGLVEQVKVGNTTHNLASTAYGICDTAAGTAAKTVNMTGFYLTKGVTVHIKFINANSAASPTLNINGTGAKPIVQYGTTAATTTSETGGWYAGAVLTLTYDGTSWVRDQGFNTNSQANYGNITTSGKIGSGNNLVVTSSGTVQAGATISSAISSQTTSTKFLREDGTWAAPSYITNTDAKVAQSSNTEDKEFPIILKNTNNTTNETNGVKYDGDVTVNPSKSKITATTIQANSRLVASKAISQIITGTGTAGSYTNSTYYPAKWTFNTGLTATDGDIFTIKIPIAGHDYGVFMSIDNGSHYYPVVLNGTSRITTHYPVNTYLTVIFEPTGSAASMFALNGQTSSTRITVTGGIWRVLNYYDSGNSGIYANYNTKSYKVGTTAITTYDLIAEDDNGYLVPAHKIAHRVGSPIFIRDGALAANATGSWVGLYDRHYSLTIRKDGNNLSLTTYAPVFLKGTISAGIFTPDTTTPFISTKANCNVSGAYYMYIGDATGATTISFNNIHPYYYYNGTNLLLYTEQSGNAATVNGLTVQTAVPANAVFTDTNKYHKTGSWNGLTYTATAVNSADELKFTIPDNYGDTKNPYASKTKNYVLAAPSNANGVPSFRALVAADIPDISGTYLKRTGGTMSGDIGFSNTGAWPSAEDEVYPLKSKGLTWRGTSDGFNLYYRVDASNEGNLVFESLDDGNEKIIFRTTMANGDFAAINSNSRTFYPINNNTGSIGAVDNKWATIYATKFNNLTLTAATTGFTIAGGSTTSKTLTVSESITLQAGSASKLAWYSAANTISGARNAYLIDESGTSVANKRNELVLGNATDKATNGSSYGRLALYSPGTTGTYLVSAESNNGWYIATLQAKTGTIAYTSDIEALDVSDITGFGAGKTLATLTETNGKIAATFQNISITKSQISDFPNRAGSDSDGGPAQTVKGAYTANGGKQNPNYFGTNKVGFLMMNTTVNNNSQYKDWIIMDCYNGSDVGGGVAFGVNRQSLGAYIMRSAATRDAWAESAELIGTHNYTTYTVKKDGTGASGSWGISITGTASYATTTADASNTLYPIGVTSGATTTLRRDTSITMQGGTITASNIRVTSGFNASWSGNPWFGINYSTTAGDNSNYTSTAQSNIMQLYVQVPVKRKSDNTITGAKFFFREWSYDSTNGNKIAHYEDFNLPGVNADRTTDVSYAIITTKNLSAITATGTITSGTWKGSVIGETYIDSAIARLASPALTGTPTAPTAADGTNTTQIATTAFVMSQFKYNDAMVYKGVVNANSDLPATHYQGWTYKVATAGTYVGVACEIGDMIICNTDGTSANNAHWNVIQNNIDGAVFKSTNAFTDGYLLAADGINGKIKTVNSLSGPFRVCTNADAAKAFKISRGNNDNEYAAHWVDDSAYHIEYTNDERVSSVQLRVINTDTENGDGANSSDYTYIFNSSGGITGATFSGNANTATEFNTAASIELTGDTTGSVSSKKGWSIVTTTKFLSGTIDSTITSSPGVGKIKYSYNVSNGTAGLFSVTNNANSIITLNKHNGNYDSQLGFSSNGNIYYRSFNGSALDTTTAWKQIAFTDSNVASATIISTTGGSTAKFWRGDNTWSNEISGGTLKITYNGNTITIGSQNASFTHIYNSASIPFIFNNTVLTTSGNLGSTTYPFNNLYIGAKGSKGIYYVGTNSTKQMITFLDNTSDGNGNGIKIGGGGTVVVGAGESAANLSVTAGTETLYLTSDGAINIEAGGDTIANRVGIQVTAAGHIIPVKAEAANNNAQDLGSSSAKWANIYATTLHGNALTAGTRWNAITQGQKWSRICLITPTITTEGSTGILSISCTRAKVVVNTTFLITLSHAGSKRCIISQIGSNNYSSVKIRGVVQSDGTSYIELYDTANSIASGTTQTWHCVYLPLLNSTVTAYTAFTTGETIPSGYAAENELQTLTGDSPYGIINITRSGTTFTATRSNGSTFTFTQQDSDTKSFTITANATDGYWDLTGTNGTNAVTYALAPYSSKQSGANFYTGTTNPDGTTRLNYNGYLYATKFNGVLTPSSWLDGQRYQNGALNIADYSNTNSYNPWIRATNTWSSGTEDAKIGRWFSFGTLGSSFYWIGSTTTRTENSYDYALRYDVANGYLYASAFKGNADTATTATNLSAKPVLAASGNNITVTAGGKTSDAFTVPYATSAGSATSATTASKLGSSNIGSARQAIYLNGGTATAGNYTVAHLGNAGKSNMNDVGRLHASVGMTQLTDPSNDTDNPMSGTTKSTGWHLYWNANYTDDPNGSNAWVAQIVNKAGTARWWVRSRSGGTITNGTAWASNWRHLVTSTETAVGNATQPVYINEYGEVVGCTAYANANVNYATTAGTANAVAWANVSGKPIEFGTYFGALNTNGWKTLGARTSGAKIYISYNNNPAVWNSATYSSSLVFGCLDTKGLLDIGHSSPIVTFGGSSNGNSTDDDPKWYFKLSGTSGQTYTFPTTSKTLAAADGTNASGTWGISITGSSASCTGNAATASKLTAITNTDAASSSAAWRRLWISYSNNTEGRPAYTDSLVYQTSTNTLKTPHLLIEHTSDREREVCFTYGSTIDFWWGVGNNNEHHGLYDVKASKWILQAGAANTWTFAGNVTGNATTATTATNLASNPSIQTSGTTQVTITAGGKTSSAYTVPYATSAGNATTLTQPSITTEANIELGTRSYHGSGANWTGSIVSMQYAGILQVCGDFLRGWQIWARRGDNATESLHWRNPNNAATAWNTERIILDTGNTTAPSTVPTLAWGTESTVFTLNGTAVKVKAMANPVSATSVKAALGTGTGTTRFLREDGTWSNIIKQASAAALGIDSNAKIGTAIKDLHFSLGSGSGTDINSGNAGGITFGNDTASYGGIYWQTSGNYGSKIHFATTGSFANGAYTRMIITSDGKVGIGTLSPDTLLTVNGNAKATKFIGALQGNADTASKISAKLATATKTYLLGTSTAITTTAANVEMTGDTGVYLTTTAGQLNATTYLVNEKVRMEYNSTDQSLDFVFV